MHWADEAIILSAKKHGESSAVARVFAQKHGVFAGVIKGINSKTNRGIVQPGNIVNVTWNARLSEHLGMFKIEMAESVAAHMMHDAQKLAALSSACTLIESAMPERHPYPKLYKEFQAFLIGLKTSESWLEEYVRLELFILAESGFGLDLSQCAATGSTENLVYVSPKSGRAVSKKAGEPYKDKMLKLPEFLRHSRKSENTEDIIDGLDLIGYFLEHWLFAPHNRKLPASRRRLIQALSKASPLQTRRNPVVSAHS